MKLNIEELAREADPDFGNPDGLLSESLCGMEAIEAFARLIVERCAQECEQTQTGLSAHGDFFSERCAKRVRDLLED